MIGLWHSPVAPLGEVLPLLAGCWMLRRVPPLGLGIMVGVVGWVLSTWWFATPTAVEVEVQAHDHIRGFLW